MAVIRRLRRTRGHGLRRGDRDGNIGREAYVRFQAMIRDARRRIDALRAFDASDVPDDCRGLYSDTVELFENLVTLWGRRDAVKGFLGDDGSPAEDLISLLRNVRAAWH